MPRRVRISLANKCQLMFGTAVVLIISVALTVGGLRMQTLVREGQQEIARELTNAWLADLIHLGGPIQSDVNFDATDFTPGLVMRLVEKDQFVAQGSKDLFLAQAIAEFKTRGDYSEMFSSTSNRQGQTYYRYARAVRASDLRRLRDGGTPQTPATPALSPAATRVTDPLEMILLIRFRADLANRQLAANRLYLLAAGLLAGLFAIGTFWFITRRIILSPVRVLRDTASKVSQGDLNTRSDINTGDEFSQLSDVFNTMLDNLQQNQNQLQSINKSLDIKLGELAQHNVSLFEANAIKTKFLANVSHELRTPLNSIIGFAEVLEESLKDPALPADDKRRRYIYNIMTSSRQLLELINDLLDLAKIEAGRMDLRVAPMSVADSVESLVNFMRPQAEKRDILLELKIDPDIPVVQTDAGKFQQILFNFLSNAIKFTPPAGIVTITAKMLDPSPPSSSPPTEQPPDKPAFLRVSVADTGPGIAPNQQEVIFEKFTQLDSTVTREHSGTGLGLAISRELAGLLQGRIELDSDLGRGAIFSLIIPLVLKPKA